MESWCSFAIFGKVGPQGGGKEAVKYPIRQNACQEDEQCSVAADSVASMRLTRCHSLGDHLGHCLSGYA